MERFPALADLPVFKGKVVSRVSFGPFQINLDIADDVVTPESGVSICIEHKVEHRDTDGTIWPYDCQADRRPPVILHRMISKEIVSVERDDLRLTFRFEDGASLSILSELGGHESGQIMWDNHYVVF